MKTYKIGLFGFGCVGQGLYTLLENNTTFEIKRIAVKDNAKERNAPDHLFTFNNSDLLDDPEIDIIVELIDDSEVAFDIVSKALEKGKPVVSANKKMIAENLKELLRSQSIHKTPLLYEGAVCGSIPILQTIKNYHNYDEVESIEGIFNGSSNYILSKQFNDGQSYLSALHQAQKLGFAESNPTMDVEGFDAKFKLCLLAYQAFGIIIRPDQVENEGITKLTTDDFEFAQNNDFKIKLIAKVEKKGHNLSLSVRPTFIHRSEPLYHIENEENAVVLKSAAAGQQILTGKGAGSLPTGLAVFSDLNHIISTSLHQNISSKPTLTVSDDNDSFIYVRSEQATGLRGLFKEVKEQGLSSGHFQIIGQVDSKTLETLRRDKEKSIIYFSQTAYNQLLRKNTYRYA